MTPEQIRAMADVQEELAAMPAPSLPQAMAAAMTLCDDYENNRHGSAECLCELVGCVATAPNIETVRKFLVRLATKGPVL